jgi:2-amino-4-hydroxy-6-hydroxymethyldihydropteridine diphosphokinase
MNKSIFLGLGSNIGNRELNLLTALNNLKSLPEITIIKSSTKIQTKAYGKTDQPNFLNQVLQIETTLKPQDLLKVCLDIENKMKRVRSIHWGPRVIDIDILFYENSVIKEDNLEIPHYDLHRRDFVLTSMNEISPKTMHPVFKKDITQLISDLKRPISAQDIV